MNYGFRSGFVVVLICAALIRCIGLDYSVPYHFHIDEHLMLTSSARLATDPVGAVHDSYFFNYGSVTRMPIAVFLAALNGVGSLNFESPRQIHFLYLAARSQSVLYGTLTVLLVMILAYRIGGTYMSLIAGLFLAFSPLHLRDSHFFTADIPVSFWITATLWATMILWNRQTFISTVLAGTCAGLSLATKLNAAPALIPLFIVLLVLRRSKVIVHVTLGFIFGFMIGNWPVFLHPGNFVDSIRLLSTWAAGTQVRQPDLQFVGTMPWLFWITNLLFFGAGPVLFFSGLVGVFLIPSLRSRVNDRNLLMIMGISYFIVMGASFQKFMRFTLPLHPFLAITAAGTVTYVWNHIKWSRYPVVALLAIHLLYGAAYGFVFARPDPRIQAGGELSTLIPEGTTVLLETTHSNPPLIEADRNKGFWESYLPELGHCTIHRHGSLDLLYIDPYRHLYNESYSTNERWMCLMSAVDQADLIIIGPRYRDQYLKHSETFPALARFYNYLDTGLLDFELIKKYENKPKLGPFTINDESSELTFRLFDRPYIRVYARRGSPYGEML